MQIVKSFSTFRALNINSLVGNIGGYVGLLMGVSISQIPYLLLYLRDKSNHIVGKWISNKNEFSIDNKIIKVQNK